MAVLSEQLEHLRTEKHKAEVEHVRKEHARDLEVEAMSKGTDNIGVIYWILNLPQHEIWYKKISWSRFQIKLS